MRPRSGSAAALVALLLVAAPAGAEVRQLEAVGALPLAPDERLASPPRDLAVRLALNEAVRRVALDLVPELEPEAAAEYLPEVLGNEPFEFTTRFRILEDRGERPALFAEDPEVEFEYVVVVEAHIDADRVEKRLVDAGLLAAGRADAPVRDVRLVIEGPASYAAYAALRALLIDGVGVRSALPVELERERAVLLVKTTGDAAKLLEDLLAKAPPELRITPLEADAEAVALRVELERLPEPVEPEAPPEGSGEPPARD